MKTKKFLMTSLLVMGMIIAKAANGFPPELVLVSQPVLTYNANSVTIYYDVQNIGDYTYRGDLYIYLDPDDGYYYAREYMRICPGRIKRIAVSIPAYRPNPSWTYTVMPYYELGDELYSFTTFEYFEPLRFCWYGYHNEPWVVVHVEPRPRRYNRPGEYRYYYDGYRPMMPPPPPGAPHGPGHHPHDMPPMNPAHHTYGYHHNNGGYPANHHPEHETPGYNHGNSSNGATVVRPGNNTPGSSSYTGTPPTSGNNGSNNNNSGVTPRPSNSNSNNNNSGATTRPSNSNSNNNNSGATTRSSSNSSNNNNSGTTTRPSSSSSSNSGRSGTSSGSGRSGSSDNSRSSSSRSSNSSSSNSSTRGSGSTGGRR